MLLKIAIPLYILLLIMAVMIKMIQVRKQIGKNPVLLLEKKSLAEVYIKKSGLLFFPLWLGGMHFFAFYPEATSRIPHLHFSSWMTLSGVILLFVAWGLFALSLIHLREAWRIGIDREKTEHLITHGIYRLIRHPIYTSFKIALVATLLIFPNVYFLTIGLAAFFGFSFLALLEEDFLRERFGSEYEEYRKKTGAFYPNIFRRMD